MLHDRLGVVGTRAKSKVWSRGGNLYRYPILQVPDEEIGELVTVAGSGLTPAGFGDVTASSPVL